MTEIELTKIMLCGPYKYLMSIVEQIQKSDNPKLAIYAQFSHIGEVLAFFGRDPEIDQFVREIGFNTEFISIFRQVSDTITLFNKLGEEDEDR